MIEPIRKPSMAMEERVYDLQLIQLQHDEKYHKDIIVMPLAERIKHMALHHAKYTGYFVEAVDAHDDNRVRRILVDAFVISLATANALNQDLGKAISHVAEGARSLSALGAALAPETSVASDDIFAFVKAFAVHTSALAKACEAWDHLESVPFRDMMLQSNLALFKLVLAEAAVLHCDLASQYCARLRGIEEQSVFDRTYARAPERL